MGKVGLLIWLVVGVFVALSHGYSVTNVPSLLSFLLAVFLWPLVLFDVNLHLNLGG